MTDDKIEFWLWMYEEQGRNARHHEALRSQATNMIVAVSAALLAFIASAATSNDHNGLIGVFLVIINLYGLLVSVKHYERSRMHINVSGKYRDMISNASEIDGRKINMARKEGKDAHPSRFQWVNRIRAYVLWSGLHLILAFVGLTVCFF